MASVPSLPDAPDVYSRFFAPWVRRGDALPLAPATLKPELVEVAAFRGVEARDLSTLAPDLQAKVHEQIGRMVGAARVDWKEICGRFDPLSREGLAAIDASYDEAAIAALHEQSDPADFGNVLLVTTCELGGVIGAALAAARPTLRWVADWPYFESTLVDARTGVVVAPFHWAVRKLSAQGAQGGLVERIGVVLEHLARRGEELRRAGTAGTRADDASGRAP